ncbi:MAG: hypothetical protein GY749_43970, partial [Desulfobacteraceae bacterium]|nr:hypothetical protein [Desulfobacteraceae bacterium]
EMDNHYQVEMQAVVHPYLPPRMLHSWSSIYHSRLVKGENFSLLRPVTSIWILKESLFPEINKCHLPFVPWNEKHGIMLSSHLAIHVLQLPKWQVSSSGHSEKDRWLYLFKEGWNVDIENPPEILNTEEMRQVMGILKDFSENQKNYLLYQKRLEAEYLRNTWEAELEKKEMAFKKERKEKERERKEKEKALKEKERERKEKERALKEKERERKEKERALKEKEREREEKDREREEKDRVLKDNERLLLLLKKAGVDPDQTVH